MNPSPSPKMTRDHIDYFETGASNIGQFITSRGLYENRIHAYSEILAVLRSLADGSAVLVPREEIERARRSLLPAHPLHAELRRWLSTTVDTAEAGKENG